MPVICANGEMRSGKTLLIVSLLKEYSKLGYTIYSNIKLKGIKFKPLNGYEIVDLFFSDKDITKTVVFIDELGNYANARRSGSEANLLISRFLLQSGKRDFIFAFTTQSLLLIDWIPIATIDLLYEPYLRTDTGKESYFTYKVRNKKGDSKYIFHTIRGEDYYNLYDTHEIVKLNEETKYYIKLKLKEQQQLAKEEYLRRNPNLE